MNANLSLDWRALIFAPSLYSTNKAQCSTLIYHTLSVHSHKLSFSVNTNEARVLCFDDKEEVPFVHNWDFLVAAIQARLAPRLYGTQKVKELL